VVFDILRPVAYHEMDGIIESDWLYDTAK